jgi:hypothetical protein
MLLVLVLLGVAVEYFGEHSKPGDDEGGGPIGALGLVGLMLFFILFGLLGVAQAIYQRKLATMPHTQRTLLSATIDPPASGYRRLAILQSSDGIYLMLSRVSEGPYEFDHLCQSVDEAKQTARERFGVAEEQWAAAS